MDREKNDIIARTKRAIRDLEATNKDLTIKNIEVHVQNQYKKELDDLKAGKPVDGIKCICIPEDACISVKNPYTEIRELQEENKDLKKRVSYNVYKDLEKDYNELKKVNTLLKEDNEELKRRFKEYGPMALMGDLTATGKALKAENEELKKTIETLNKGACIVEKNFKRTIEEKDALEWRLRRLSDIMGPYIKSKGYKYSKMSEDRF